MASAPDSATTCCQAASIQAFVSGPRSTSTSLYSLVSEPSQRAMRQSRWRKVASGQTVFEMDSGESGEFDLIVVDRKDRSLQAARRRLHPRIVDRLRPVLDAGRVAEALRSAAQRGRIFPIARDPIPVSSSEIRRRAARGGDLDDLVPPAVAIVMNSRSFLESFSKIFSKSTLQSFRDESKFPDGR